MRLLNYLFVPLLSLAVPLAVVSVILVPDDRVLAQEWGREDFRFAPSRACSGCTTCNGKRPLCNVLCVPPGPHCDPQCVCEKDEMRNLCFCKL